MVLFVAHLAFWLDEKGIAEHIFNLHLTPSMIPLYVLVMIYALALLIFTVHLSKKIKGLQESNLNHSRKAVIIMALVHLLAFSCSSLFVFSQDSNSMTSVIPGLFSLYFAIMFIISLILLFILFRRRNKDKLEF
ncbi:hypothetical protein [Mesobacillus thioparans]|uniref:hypothetical protein n=1 Tax=Mesobacillus thioparans TaxID=370439 RepID=UPI0039EDEAF4